DLTLVQLAEDAPVQPAPLLRETMDNSSEFVGPPVTFVGYGVTNGNTQTGFGLRRVATFPIQVVGPAQIGGSSGAIDDTEFYYSLPGRNTCNGDSGGPAFLVRGGVERHMGTTSTGDLSCSEDGVDARTDAPQIAAFIQPTIDAFENRDPCR